MDPQPKFIDLKDLPIIESIKEAKCYVTLDYLNARKSAQSFSLPTETGYHGVKLTTELFSVPELMFRDTMVTESENVLGIETFLRDHDFDVVLCGGSSLFYGNNKVVKKSNLKVFFVTMLYLTSYTGLI